MLRSQSSQLNYIFGIKVQRLILMYLNLRQIRLISKMLHQKHNQSIIDILKNQFMDMKRKHLKDLRENTASQIVHLIQTNIQQIQALYSTVKTKVLQNKFQQKTHIINLTHLNCIRGQLMVHLQNLMKSQWLTGKRYLIRMKIIYI